MSGGNSEFIFDWFEHICLLCSSSVAVIDETTGAQVTYGELLDKATYFSEILQVILDPESANTYEGTPLVCVLTSRSIASVLSILSLFHCGAAFTLVDGLIFEKNSKDVNEKLHVLTHPNYQLLIVDEANLPHITKLETSQPLPPILVIDRLGNIKDISQCTKRPDPVVPVRGAAEVSLAYLHYTSGCLGKPKGVLVSHRGLANVLRTFTKVFQLSEKDRVLFHSDMAYESTLLEILLPLVAGAGLVIASSKSKRNPERLMEVLETYDITFLQSILYQFDRLLSRGWKGKANLTVVVDCDMIHYRFHELISTCARVFNVYSCPESTLWASYYQFPRDMTMETIHTRFGSHAIPIGIPISNLQFFVLNEKLEEVPENQSGELYISGYGTSLGYLNNKLQTALKFIPNPHLIGSSSSGSPGKASSVSLGNRCFKTGDIVRRLSADGVYVLERRLDDVAKYKGFKFELKEVRLYLEANSKVAQALPIVLEDALIGLIKLRPDTIVEDEASFTVELKEHLFPLLPHYMIPKDFIIMENIPVLPHGRIDRQQLLLPHGVSIRRTHSIGSELGGPESVQGDEVSPAGTAVKKNPEAASAAAAPFFSSWRCCSSSRPGQVYQPGQRPAAY